ncbi:MAG: DUF1778 domain-containing protein [Alphaproteobacteria bacterium]|nr:DUF1778 domain-containing protein [Alphaproteobacteria bacterium]
MLRRHPLRRSPFIKRLQAPMSERPDHSGRLKDSLSGAKRQLPSHHAGAWRPSLTSPAVVRYGGTNPVALLRAPVRRTVASRRRYHGSGECGAKRRIERAASAEGKTVSAFILSSALETAGRTIDGHKTLALAREDAARFVDALADPPPPNDRLRAALEEHARRVDSR